MTCTSTTSLRRLERCYGSLPPVLLHEIGPSGATMGSAIQKSDISDHVPVVFSLEPVGHRPVPATSSLPRWLVSSPGFKEDIVEAMNQHVLSDDPFKAIQEMKDIFRLAAAITRGRARDRTLVGREVTFQYLILAWKSSRCGNVKGLQRSCSGCSDCLRL